MNIWIIILAIAVTALTVSNIIMYCMIRDLQAHDHTHFPPYDFASMYPSHSPLENRVKYVEQDIETFGKTISYFAKLLKPMATNKLKETIKNKDNMFHRASLADIDDAIKEYTRVYGWDNDIMDYPKVTLENPWIKKCNSDDNDEEEE